MTQMVIIPLQKNCNESLPPIDVENGQYGAKNATGMTSREKPHI